MDNKEQVDRSIEQSKHTREGNIKGPPELLMQVAGFKDD